LESVDGSTELGGYVGEKGGEGCGNVGFTMEGKSPHKMRIIIQYHKIINKPELLGIGEVHTSL
jgi:hypothetical protein